jgi:hypothetical protein
MREALSATFQLAETDLEAGTFRGFASVFNTQIDAAIPTIIHPGAFTKTLQENGRRVRVLWQHDETEPIGIPVTMAETGTGLEVVGKISNTTRGRDCLTLMRDKVVTDLSIGFDPIVYDFEERENMPRIRHVRELRLWEFSPVTWGANEPAKIAEVNARVRAALGTDAEAIQQYLDRVRSTADPEQAMRLLFGPVVFLCRQQNEGDALRALVQRHLRELASAEGGNDEPPAAEPDTTQTEETPAVEPPAGDDAAETPAEPEPATEQQALRIAALANAKLEQARRQMAAWQ